jgi:hypothetical protein
LKQASVFHFAANGSRASIWNSGAAPAADEKGNLYFSVANGDFDTNLNAEGFPARGDYGNAARLAAGNLLRWPGLASICWFDVKEERLTNLGIRQRTL